MDNLLSQEEVKHFLNVGEGEVDHLIRNGKLHAYKIGGTYVRFRKEEVLTVKQELNGGKRNSLGVPWFYCLADFWRFNNFYILSLFLIALLFYVIVIRP